MRRGRPRKHTEPAPQQLVNPSSTDPTLPQVGDEVKGRLVIAVDRHYVTYVYHGSRYCLPHKDFKTLYT